MVLFDPAKVGQLLAAAGAQVVIVRPDRYILGLGDTPQAFERLIRSIPQAGRTVPAHI